MGRYHGSEKAAAEGIRREAGWAAGGRCRHYGPELKLGYDRKNPAWRVVENAPAG
jgi:hypothetical protein